LLVPFWVILNDFVFFKIAPNMNMIVGSMLIAFGLLILIYRS
jgi:drug/metabolite transporter (DMT)-like permease